MKKKSGEITEQIDENITSMPTPPVETDGTEVEVRLGMTIKLKRQYEMARADVFVRLPGTKDKVDELAQEARATAKKHLAEIVRGIRNPG